ncbi:hypothetical protein A3Q56_02580 [Intoshia linei]|uniref:Homeobox domain-containing protein n=1 Tax=Intoshia linei TaxID=1819745 RepID=A0A177B5V1_9BILA|nr:hypothetical protein A3Q56_02580 [Intoshia linei]
MQLYLKENYKNDCGKLDNITLSNYKNVLKWFNYLKNSNVVNMNKINNINNINDAIENDTQIVNVKKNDLDLPRNFQFNSNCNCKCIQKYNPKYDTEFNLNYNQEYNLNSQTLFQNNMFNKFNRLPNKHDPMLMENHIYGFPDTMKHFVKNKYSKRQLCILNKWIKFNANNPYASKSDIRLLVLKTGLTYKQIRKWLSNKRMRK